MPLLSLPALPVASRPTVANSVIGCILMLNMCVYHLEHPMLIFKYRCYLRYAMWTDEIYQFKSKCKYFVIHEIHYWNILYTWTMTTKIHRTQSNKISFLWLLLEGIIQWLNNTLQSALPILKLTRSGRVTHTCIIVGWGNGLAPIRQQAINSIAVDILLINPLRTNFSDSWIKI